MFREKNHIVHIATGVFIYTIYCIQILYMSVCVYNITQNIWLIIEHNHGSYDKQLVFVFVVFWFFVALLVFIEGFFAFAKHLHIELRVRCLGFESNDSLENIQDALFGNVKLFWNIVQNPVAWELIFISSCKIINYEKNKK